MSSLLVFCSIIVCSETGGKLSAMQQLEIYNASLEVTEYLPVTQISVQSSTNTKQNVQQVCEALFFIIRNRSIYSTTYSSYIL